MIFDIAIPDGVFQIQSLERLYLDQNSMTGMLPSDIGLLLNLKSIDLFGNSVVGKIPTEMGLVRFMIYNYPLIYVLFIRFA